MIGAIFGDIVGSVYESHPIKTTDFPLFHRYSTITDDTILTIATAHAILNQTAYEDAYRNYYRRYPDAGYGSLFHRWARDISAPPYGSYGNGSAMRVAPVGWAFDDMSTVLREAERSASVTHDHPEGKKGAQAVAASVFLARRGASKNELAGFVKHTFAYNLDVRLDAIRPTFTFDSTCQGTVPVAIVAFLESTSCEDAVRRAVSLGGDADTLGCIAGSIAEAFFGMHYDIEQKTMSYLDNDLRAVVTQFQKIYCVRRAL